MRGRNGGIGNVNTFETINAAATAIASAESRAPHATVQKRRWTSCWSIYWCFGSQKHSKRIGHAVLVPETTRTMPNQSDVPAVENTITLPAIIVPLAAPPSSPASFLPSEPASAVQSPVGVVSLTSISANMYSPGGPRSIFAIGPYAHETQLVSPPVFSTFTTEPSTAPFTPPPESVHLTTPSSPEVPFAQLLDPNHRSNDVSPRYPSSRFEYLNYQLYPGSPVGQFTSPGLGTSSPFPDPEHFAAGLYFPGVQSKVPHKLLSLELPATRELGPRQGCGSLTPESVCPKPCDGFPLDLQKSTVSHLQKLPNGSPQNKVSVNHRVSFELTAEDVVRSVAKEPRTLPKGIQNDATGKKDEHSGNLFSGSSVSETPGDGTEKAAADGDEGHRGHKQRSLSLGSIKEFNFDNTNGEDSRKPCIGSYWWANEEAAGKEGEPSKNWSFFPMLQPGVN
ncbi:hypothetical protein Ancab_032685 [Ancistrocladus abbreviatus]